MKKTILIITMLFQLFSASGQEKLHINTEKSTIKWIGELTFNFGGHDGFIKFKEGYFIKENNVITGGKFIIDMNSITNTDINKKDANESLVNHLKNEDFFDVKKYPVATLKIKSVEYYKGEMFDGRIYADITIKGITNPVKFYVNFNYKEKELKTRFKIDRREWDIMYQSKFKNSAISDAIGFNVLIKL